MTMIDPVFFFVVTPSNHVIPLPSITGTTLTKAASVREEWRGRVDEVVRRIGNELWQPVGWLATLGWRQFRTLLDKQCYYY